MMSLTALGLHYKKPEWLFEELEELLVNQIGIDEIDKLVSAIKKHKEEWDYEICDFEW